MAAAPMPRNEAGKSPRSCILGGGGYLGQNLCLALQRQGHFVVLFDLHHTRFADIPINERQVRRIKGCILDRYKLRKALKDCSACFHLVGYGMTGADSLNRERCMQVNYEGTKVVISECVQMNVPRLLYSSTVGVIFASEELHHADENTPRITQFLNAYCESKCRAEEAIVAASRRHSLATCALRFRGIYGPGELRMCAKIWDLCSRGLICATFRKSSLQALTQFSHVENCTNAMVLAEHALRNGTSGVNGQVYNIVDDAKPVDSWRFWDPMIVASGHTPPRWSIPYWVVYLVAFLMEYLYRFTGIAPAVTRFEVNVVAITNTYSVEKAKRELGYAPVKNHDLDETIDHLVQLRNSSSKVDASKNDGNRMTHALTMLLAAGSAISHPFYSSARHFILLVGIATIILFLLLHLAVM